MISLLLAHGADPDSRGPYHYESETPLMLAAGSGNLESVRALLAYGANPHSEDRNGYAALTHAAGTAANSDVVRLLLQYGASPDNHRAKGYTPLYAASSGGFTNTVHVLLESGANPDVPYYGLTPLREATRLGNKDVALLLLAYDADPDGAQGGRDTPLAYALNHDDIDIARMLVDFGADIDRVMGDRGSERRAWFLYGLDPDLAPKLKRFVLNPEAFSGKAKVTPLTWAASIGHTNLICLLLARGVHIEQRDIGGNTPLHRAAWKGKSEAAHLLIERGAQVESASKSGRTPLSAALRSGDMRTVHVLLKAGADINKRHRSSAPTPFQQIAFFPQGETALLALMLEHGGDPNVSTRKGHTPLFGAARSGETDVAALLLAHGATLDHRAADGQTPLMHAVAATNHTSLGMTKLLLAHGADPNGTDKKGISAIEYANSTDRAQLLMAYGATVDW